MIFNDPDRSWDLFLLMESFSDGMGGWKIQEVTGIPVLDMSDAMLTDLVLWKRLSNIVRTQIEKANKEERDKDNAT